MKEKQKILKQKYVSKLLTGILLTYTISMCGVLNPDTSIGIGLIKRKDNILNKI